MPLEYLRDGDIGFIGLNSRDNPASLPKGIVTKSENFRLDRGVATIRKGLQRKTSPTIAQNSIYGTGVYIDTNGQDIFVIILSNSLVKYNPNAGTFSQKIYFPNGETIDTQDGCDVTVAVNKVYITRGHSKRPLIWDMATSIIIAPVSGTGAEFPNCSGLLYYANRLIASGQDHRLGYTPTVRARDSVGVSNYLDFQHWDALDVFTFNQGGNDEVVAVTPWTLNEFIVFMRNSIFYANVGNGRYATGDGITGTTAMIQSLVSDIGCSAKRSVVQANGGVIFLSDSGVYFMNPTQVGGNESMRLLTSADPISSPVDDVIKRINKEYAYRSVGIYWNNRYYLAVPLDDSNVNNVVLIYNFILKNWESVDTYPAGFDVFNFALGKKDNKKRLFCFDTDQGVFLMEELDYDEYGQNQGTPLLPFILPSVLNEFAFIPNTINAKLTTRLYTFDNLRDKRFSSVEVDLVCSSGSQIRTYFDTINPDTTTLVDAFGSPFDEDVTRRLATRKVAYGAQLRFEVNNLSVSIRATNIIATLMGKQNISKK